MKKIFFNMSMVNGQKNGLSVYSINLEKRIKEIDNNYDYVSLYIKKRKLLSLYRLFWNFFFLPFRVRKGLLYSFSTHGTPFIKNQIITIHDLICFAFPKQHRFQYYYFKYLVPIIIKNCRKIVAISNFTKDEILKNYNISQEKIEVIYNGITPLKYVYDEQTEKDFKSLLGESPFFIIVGASYRHKNIENLIQAIKIFNTSICKFIIVSKKDRYGYYLKRCVEKEELDNILFVDNISINLLSKLYENSIANIYVSLYEGFGFPPLEAASLGTISIVSDIPVMREILKGNAIYVNPNSPDDIADKIIKVYTSTIDLKSLKKGLIPLFENYSWEKSAQKVLSLIEKEYE